MEELPQQKVSLDFIPNKVPGFILWKNEKKRSNEAGFGDTGN